MVIGCLGVERRAERFLSYLAIFFVFSSANGAKTDQTQTPFCVWTNPDCNSTVDPNRAEQDFGEFRVQFVGPGF